MLHYESLCVQLRRYITYREPLLSDRQRPLEAQIVKILVETHKLLPWYLPGSVWGPFLGSSSSFTLQVDKLYETRPPGGCAQAEVTLMVSAKDTLHDGLRFLNKLLHSVAYTGQAPMARSSANCRSPIVRLLRNALKNIASPGFLISALCTAWLVAAFSRAPGFNGSDLSCIVIMGQVYMRANTFFWNPVFKKSARFRYHDRPRHELGVCTKHFTTGLCLWPSRRQAWRKLSERLHAADRSPAIKEVLTGIPTCGLGLALSRYFIT